MSGAPAPSPFRSLSLLGLFFLSHSPSVSLSTSVSRSPSPSPFLPLFLFFFFSISGFMSWVAPVCQLQIALVGCWDPVRHRPVDRFLEGIALRSFCPSSGCRRRRYGEEPRRPRLFCQTPASPEVHGQAVSLWVAAYFV